MVYFLSSYSLLSTSTLGLTASYFSSFSFPSNSKIRCMDAGGLDSDGREFNTAEDMWREQAGDPSKKTQWYRDGVSYWEGVKANMDGVLGGFANVNEPDISCSEDFLNILLSERFPPAADARRQPLVALDCGSGIGRVTKNLLIRYFNEVDLLEPVSHFLETARETLASGCQTNSDMHKAVNFYCVPLQDFTPDTARYDVIWIQWCIGHLTDEDFVSFFKSAKVGLKAGGFFVLKENIARSGFVLDNEDRSVTRSDLYFKELFSRCGLHVYKSKDQKGFPEELFAVKMYALTTDPPKKAPRAKSKTSTNRPKTIM
ncbi:hypothetical protein JHK82_012758 [Glycine max]|uniref:Alpha N-terminal protein methyltransferase 1 n=1 Tax=Glycine soja TaxID=3848 RepID=A0A445KN05_GLYSO|nr:alpha N-terminal protein methyltransferase 1-like isoform X1 [Glycine soja]KAG5057778.1 hypothetical protein JHK86_012774 [Glycine max]KAG5154789.1 hypothetical protein JHK82_012758 [Glycine max]RZC12154.1 Alpha N-terminal protein methyltransferase 1 [Glycine soja]